MPFGLRSALKDLIHFSVPDMRNCTPSGIFYYIKPFVVYLVLALTFVYCRIKGHAVAQLVEALRYKPEGRGFDSRWCHWNFSLT
jgi:hypothetical protein